jgi:hypothetical protein
VSVVLGQAHELGVGGFLRRRHRTGIRRLYH